MKYTIALLALSLLLITIAYYELGYYWDLIAHILYAKGIVKGDYNLIEWERAPLSGLVLIPFYIFFGNNSGYFYIIANIIITYALAIEISRKLNYNELIFTSILLTPFPLLFYTIFNGAEILSINFLLFGIFLFLKNKNYFSLFLALAALTKVIAFPFVVLILFSNNKKLSFLYYIFPFIPWLIFNYIAFGNPLFNYIETIKIALNSSFPNFNNLYSLIYMLAPFLIFYFVLFLIYLKENYGKSQNKLYSLNDPIFIIFFINLFILLLSGLFSNAVYTIPRWSYIIYVPFVFIFANRVRNWDKAIFYINIMLFIFLVFNMNLIVNVYSTNERNPNLITAINYIKAHNYSIVASNVWVLLDFYNISSISPYNNYTYKPILIINGIGTSPKLFNLENYKEIIINKNTSLYLPVIPNQK